MSPATCTECRRPLLISDGFQMCCVRTCGEFGRPVDTDYCDEIKPIDSDPLDSAPEAHSTEKVAPR